MVNLEYSHTNLFKTQLCLLRAYCNIYVEHNKYLQIDDEIKATSLRESMNLELTDTETLPYKLYLIGQFVSYLWTKRASKKDGASFYLCSISLTRLSEP